MTKIINSIALPNGAHSLRNRPTTRVTTTDAHGRRYRWTYTDLRSDIRRRVG